MSTTFAAMERLRGGLNDLIATAAAEVERERQQAAAEAALAIEHASSAAAMSGAYQQGREDERRRILALLGLQRETLGRAGLNAISLATLARMIQEAE
jgi:hypothetical protein